jgi:adenosylhomocysteine nucleosidase
VAILFALNIEAAGVLDSTSGLATTRNASFVEHCGGWGAKQVVVAETGVGRASAARAAVDLLSIHKPAWVVSAGFAGALNDDLKRGQFLMASSVCDLHVGELEVGFKIDPIMLQTRKNLKVGRLLTVDSVIRTEAEKRELGRRFRAVACDMETAAIAAVCRQEKTRFLSVRVISDAVDDELPPEIEKLMASKSFARQLGAAAGAIFKRPSSIKDMWKLREDAVRLSDRLATFLSGVVEQLV